MRIPVWVVAALAAATTVWGQQPPEMPPPGNLAAGAAIVAGKGACQTCHRIRDTGSRVGPDLTDVGATRRPDQLQASLLDPDAEILPENRSYRVVTRDGTAVTGRLLNLDTFQVMMIDSKEQLRSFQKSDLREFAFIDKSTMPSFRSTLSPQEIADVVAYLSSLKGVPAE